ncbi:MAG TPA: rhomboid family intramembrane serine protease [Tenuifilaceae bacterium]|nr:rhomboid family intramembrane serine protease [Tenuifilaceae bacterium]HOC36727.1 rhomboid family intramembrane serine protease [Tenuifilaceae bacterium]HPA67417.1 rhomboid family intramembrane serine protease [Tenuifilaceae bacterium]HPM90276.1 rhomboid family intramembrane serine protease [Tenuifilaceae bacterium]HPS04294.1 rhomboid family intramembrane serine protease [Tenuifilaceae bacterium]
MSISKEIKDSFRFGSSLTQLIYINLAIFLIYSLVRVIMFIGGTQPGSSYAHWLAVPAGLHQLLSRPWTLLTYMFFHENFLHILFNLLWLYWFGRLFLQHLSQRQLVGVYLLGGITGAIFFIAAYNILPVFRAISSEAMALGASASVLAIVIAVSTLKPNNSIYILFLGEVKLKYLALATIIIDIISIPVSNPGGHIAHLGGAVFGFSFIKLLNRGTDLTKFLNIFSRVKKPKAHRSKNLKVSYRRPETDYEYNRRKANEQKSIDRILDKIAKSGYDSLSKEEKETLFRMKNDSVN